MFKTDETVRFGQILSARTLRYGKFNEYIIIIIIIAVRVWQRQLQYRFIIGLKVGKLKASIFLGLTALFSRTLHQFLIGVK